MTATAYYCHQYDADVMRDPDGKPWRWSVDLACGHTVSLPLEDWD